MSIRRLFIHGAGRRGAAAWPHVADADGAESVAFAPESTMAEQVEQLVAHCRDDRMLLFAHSIGAVPAVLAAERLDLAGMVLVEPALYDLARGDAAIERHIAIVTEARAQFEFAGLKAFWTILRPLMFGGLFDTDAWERERPLALRWSKTNVPWGHGVRASMLDDIPALVVTGGWNDEYETIARVLVGRGARSVIVSGAQHRPMDLPEFPGIVTDFERSLASRSQ